MADAFTLAQANGAGALIGHTNGYVYEVRDYSPGTRQAFGFPCYSYDDDSYTRGVYQLIPAGACTLISTREGR